MLFEKLEKHLSYSSGFGEGCGHGHLPLGNIDTYSRNPL